MWLLGSSAQSAIWAAQLGLPYAFADFINPDGADIARDYRERAAEAARARRSACGRSAAETDEEAERLASSIAMAMRDAAPGRRSRSRRRRRRCATSPSSGPAPARPPRIVGSPETSARGIEEVAPSTAPTR